MANDCTIESNKHFLRTGDYFQLWVQQREQQLCCQNQFIVLLSIAVTMQS